MTTKLQRGALFSATALVAGMLGAPAMSQVAAKETAEDLREIVVTAQRRSESLQDVPIAVSALQGSVLEKAGVTRTDELYLLAPSLVQHNAARSVVTYIRGVGTQAGTLGEEPEISTYIDGVYIASAQGARFDVNNVERIEVLKGPQGTLFGRNSTGGLIQVVTRTPSETPVLEAAAGYGSYGTSHGRLYASTGLGANLAADLALTATHQAKGFGHNFTTGEDVNRTESFGVRSKLRWVSGGDLEATLSADYSRFATDAGNVRQIYPGAIILGGGVPIGGFQDAQAAVFATTPFSADKLPFATQYGISFTGVWSTEPVRLTSISAYRRYVAKGVFDTDASAAPITDAFTQEYTDTLQQEVLLNGDVGRLNWAFGGMFLYIKAEYDPVGTRSAQLLQVLNFDRYNTMQTYSFAGYGELSYEVLPATSLTLGARYTFDMRQIHGQQFAAAGLPGFTPGSILPIACPVHGAAADPATGRPPTVSVNTCRQTADWDAVSWRIVLDHKFSDDVMVYGSVNRGFKSGMFNLLSVDAPPVNPETLTGYMAGVKTRALDRRLRFNVEAFLYDYENIQLVVPSAVGGRSTLLFNAGSGESKGIDADLSFDTSVGSGELTLTSGLSLLDAKYKKFPFNICSERRLMAPYGNISAPCAGRGLNMVRAPNISASLAADYTWEVGEGRLGIHGDLYHSGRFYWTSDNRLSQAPYTVLNAQASYEFPGEKWRVIAWVKNLTDKAYYREVKEDLTFGDQFTAQPPRTLGFTVEYKM